MSDEPIRLAWIATWYSDPGASDGPEAPGLESLNELRCGALRCGYAAGGEFSFRNFFFPAHIGRLPAFQPAAKMRFKRIDFGSEDLCKFSESRW